MESKRGVAQLIVEPSSQVHFPGPPLRPARATIKLINNTTNRIAFKIKTTAPSFYGVRPNSGVVLPRNTADVEIARQPFTHEQSPKISHKFMVQSLMVPDDVDDVSKLWDNVNTTQLGIQKLRCVFEDTPARSSVEQPSRASKDKEPKIKINTSNEAPPTTTTTTTTYQSISSRRASLQKGSGNASPLKMSSIKENEVANPKKSQESKASIRGTSGSGSRGGNKKPLIEGNSNQTLSRATSKSNAPQVADDSMQLQQQQQRTKKFSESMESIRRLLEGKENKNTSTPNGDVEQKKKSSGQLKVLDSAELAVAGKPQSKPTITPNKSENLQRSGEDLEQQNLTTSKFSTPFRPSISYHSNDSTSAVSTNPFSPKLTPVRLPSPPTQQQSQQSQQQQQPQLMTVSQTKPKKEKTERDSTGVAGGIVSPKPSKQKSSDIFTALQFATLNTEIHQLRTENKYLMKENSVLKEEIQHRSRIQSPVRSEYTVPHSELLQMQPQHSMQLPYIVASMTFAILCLILGKFVL